MTSRSRGAAERPSSCTAAFETVTTDIAVRRTAFFERLCGAPCRAAAANAGGSIGKRRFGMDDGKSERKGFGSETPTDAIGILPRRRAQPRLERQAHIYRRSTAASRPKESFIARDSASGQASWDVAGTRFAHPFERALPAPACPSPAKAPRAPVVVPER